MKTPQKLILRKINFVGMNNMNNSLYHILETNGFEPAIIYEAESRELLSYLEKRQREIRNEDRHPNPERDFVVVPFSLVKETKDRIKSKMPQIIRGEYGGTIKTCAVDGPTKKEFDEMLSSMKNPYVVFKRYQDHFDRQSRDK